MTDADIDQRIQAIQWRLAAVKGPWHAWHYHGSHPVTGNVNWFFSAVALTLQPPDTGGAMSSPSTADGVVASAMDYRDNRPPHEPGSAPNAAFVAHARDDIPWLLALVAQLRAELDEAHE